MTFLLLLLQDLLQTIKKTSAKQYSGFILSTIESVTVSLTVKHLEATKERK